MKRFILGLLVFIGTFPAAYALLPVDFVSALNSECYCVLWLREVQGINIHGDAWTIKANLPKTQIREGDVVLFDYGKVDHAALIVDVIQARDERPEIYLTIRETNFKPCTVGTRTIPLSDPSIRGFYRP